MITINEALSKLNERIDKIAKVSMISAIIAGLFTHMPMLVSDIPNHDGLFSQYFDQNMITSGRWFLGTACGISSYFSLPWVTGVLSLIYIAVAAAVLNDIFKIKDPVFAVLSSVIIAVFPSLASNFAYAFTMDGYMLGMLFCVLSVWCVKKYEKFGWITGALFLSFGMGCYQAYVCIAILLCLFRAALILADDLTVREKCSKIFKYVLMGTAGVAFYYILLKVLLLIQGKVLDTYQGINGMAEGNGLSIIGTVKLMYSDFATFTLGKVFIPNVFAGICILIIAVSACILFIRKAIKTKAFKKPLFYLFTLLFLIVIPCAMNAIMVISTDVTYHVLMRYQWAFLIAIMISYIDREVTEKMKLDTILVWLAVLSCAMISFTYAVTDNIAYSNLQKKYEKTYAYCLRVADRIEQTEGYYQGIPVALVGVVGQDSFPTTDITEDVTGGLLGVSGDYLLYKSENYGDFFKYYMGITFNVLSSDEVVNFYNEDFYAEMESFPGATSVINHDGVIYVKTENIR